jgi:hypothetical protein
MNYIIKTILGVFFVVSMGLSFNANAYTLCQQRKNGSCNWDEPFIVVEGDKAYQTKPGTRSRDYLANSWEKHNGVYFTKDPNGATKYSQPGLIIEGEEIYQSSPKSFRRDYLAPDLPAYKYLRP